MAEAMAATAEVRRSSRLARYEAEEELAALRDDLRLAEEALSARMVEAESRR
jgi:hypothetical protein